MKTYTTADIESWNPCLTNLEDGGIPSGWSGTLQDIVEARGNLGCERAVALEDTLWAVHHAYGEFVSRRFMAYCLRAVVEPGNAPADIRNWKEFPRVCDLAKWLVKVTDSPESYKAPGVETDLAEWNAAFDRVYDDMLGADVFTAREYLAEIAYKATCRWNDSFYKEVIGVLSGSAIVMESAPIAPGEELESFFEDADYEDYHWYPTGWELMDALVDIVIVKEYEQ